MLGRQLPKAETMLHAAAESYWPSRRSGTALAQELVRQPPAAAQP